MSPLEEQEGHNEELPIPSVEEDQKSPEISEPQSIIAQRAKEIIESDNLPEPGETRSWELDQFTEKRVNNPNNPSLNIVSWNIERGYNVDQQIEHLRGQDVDVLCLQEVDWNCIRTGETNIALKMAEALGFKYIAYSTEFIELDERANQEGTIFKGSKRHSSERIGKGGGVHGQAVLSKFPIKGTDCIKLDTSWYDWENRETPAGKAEPRIGQRVSQKAEIQIGNRTITVYNAHLEDKEGGTLGRLAQYDQIADDAENEENPVIIVGDFNTLSHGVARALPGNKGDFFTKLKRFGRTSAEHWEELEFSDSKRSQQINEGVLDPRQKKFRDPHPTKESTFKIGPVYSGKLDWTLFEKGKFEIENHKIGPWKLSDHRLLQVKAKIL